MYRKKGGDDEEFDVFEDEETNEFGEAALDEEEEIYDDDLDEDEFDEEDGDFDEDFDEDFEEEEEEFGELDDEE